MVSPDDIAVTGRYRDPTGRVRGFLWDGEEYWAVDVAEDVDTFPADVNNSGVITGSFSRETCCDEWDHQGFLATPIPSR